MPIEPELKFVDLPEVPETFADSVNLVDFINGVIRIELCVHRLDRTKAAAKRTGRKYPAARLVLTTQAAQELKAALTGVILALEALGVIQKPKPAAGKSSRKSK